MWYQISAVCSLLHTYFNVTFLVSFLDCEELCFAKNNCLTIYRLIVLCMTMFCYNQFTIFSRYKVHFLNCMRFSNLQSSNVFLIILSALHIVFNYNNTSLINVTNTYNNIFLFLLGIYISSQHS